MSIELSENSIKIIDTQKLTDNHVVIVSVDLSDLSDKDQVKNYLEEIQEGFESVLDAKVIVLTHNVEISIVESDDTDDITDQGRIGA